MAINPQSNLFGRVPRLGLPTLLQSYLLYDQTLELEEETEMEKEYNELTEQMKLMRLEDKTMKQNEAEENLTSSGCAEGGADVEIDDDKATRQRIHIRKFKFTFKRQ